jgi:hypothetical protein
MTARAAFANINASNQDNRAKSFFMGVGSSGAGIFQRLVALRKLG